MLKSLGQTIPMGPLNIPAGVILFFICLVIYSTVTRFLYKDRKELLGRTDKILFNIFFIAIAVWKLSPLIFQFSTVLSNPDAILYLPGGKTGLFAASGATAVYVTAALLRQKKGRKEAVKALVLNITVFAVIFILLGAGMAVINKKTARNAPISVAEGVVVPDFSLQDGNGKIYRLSDYEGQTVVLNFWASWCPPCRAEMPELVKFAAGINEEEVVFLSINLYSTESDPENFKSYLEENRLNFPVLFDSTGSVADDYQISTVPTTFVISRIGEIHSIRNGAVTADLLEGLVSDLRQ